MGLATFTLSTPAGGLGRLFSSVSIDFDKQLTASAAAFIAGSAWASSFSASFSIAAASALAIDALSASMLAAACCFSVNSRHGEVKEDIRCHVLMVHLSCGEGASIFYHRVLFPEQRGLES